MIGIILIILGTIVGILGIIIVVGIIGIMGGIMDLDMEQITMAQDMDLIIIFQGTKLQGIQDHILTIDKMLEIKDPILTEHQNIIETREYKVTHPHYIDNLDQVENIGTIHL